MFPRSIWQLLASLLLALGVAHHALAECRFTGLAYLNYENPTRTINVPPSAAIGTVVYDESWRHTIQLTCLGSTQNSLESFNATNRDVSPAQGLVYDSRISIAGAVDQPQNGGGMYHIFPDGAFTKDVEVTVRLQIKRSSNASLSTTAVPDRYASSTNPVFNYLVSTSSLYAGSAVYFRVHPAIRVFPTTCEFINLSNVVLPPAPLSSFPDNTAGSASTITPTNFTISMACTNVSAAKAIGIGFSAVYQHASRAPGVIAVDQGPRAAKNIGLQIVNGTTEKAIQFEAFEQGPTPLAGDGTYNYPFRVRYVQTAPDASAGTVTGRVEVRAMYQ